MDDLVLHISVEQENPECLLCSCIQWKPLAITTVDGKHVGLRCVWSGSHVCFA